VQLIKETGGRFQQRGGLRSALTAGWQEGKARTSKTKLDWAIETVRLLEERYRHCPAVALVRDNISTYTTGAFYQGFPPARARALTPTELLPRAEAWQLAEHH
jgi:hypothetical protein